MREVLNALHGLIRARACVAVAFLGLFAAVSPVSSAEGSGSRAAASDTRAPHRAIADAANRVVLPANDKQRNDGANGTSPEHPFVKCDARLNPTATRVSSSTPCVEAVTDASPPVTSALPRAPPLCEPAPYV